MKIKEAVNRIESTSKSIFAWEREGYIHIAFNTFTVLVVPYEAKTMFDCHFVNSNLELPTDVKAQLSGIIGKFLRTPIKERYPDKKYRLRWISDKDNCKNYLDYSSGMWDFVESKNEATIFAESGLNHLKLNNPLLAPAIDAMKEPAEDIEHDND
ncbi:hypothetical protein [Limosilactobacillus reuteri]|uniref:hypothetical protein n=1 Tax=Limosilactobacillus reuteri TaxID=1598 RepID=UPI001E57785F|nr:hypothetical protein [Limosilactobacillus reuteri]MCC4346136.1 hypothetical protein [Limosilactobacillus reuteri]